LSAECERIYRALVDPVHVVAPYCAQPETIRRGTLELFEEWEDTLQSSVLEAEKFLQLLEGRWPRTWLSGVAIRRDIITIIEALSSAIHFLACGPGLLDHREEEDLKKRAALADALFRFDAPPLLKELATAVVDDCAVQRGRLTPEQGEGSGTDSQELNPTPFPANATHRPPSPPDTSYDEEDVNILEALGRNERLLKTVDQIAGASHVSEKTVRVRLNRFIEQGLASRPKGEKQGATITPKGAALLKELQPTSPPRRT
jgi:hypothetical protein